MVTLPPEPPFTIREYEASLYWTKKSKSILDDKECTCQLCGRKRWKWQVRNKAWKRVLRFAVHHVSYANVPYEKEEDFLTLCYACHTLSHDVWQKRNLGPVYEALAKILERFGFRYDKTSKIEFYAKQGDTT